MTGSEYNKLFNALACIRNKTDFNPVIGIILGSGLGNMVKLINKPVEVSYSSIEGFPVSTVSGHKGSYVFGYIDDIPVVCMQGRVHYYEGYDIFDVVMPTRIMALLGVRSIIFTNAAGGIKKDLKPGDFMLINDHISTFVPSPLIGYNYDELGVRFPDMSRVYDEELCGIIKNTADSLQMILKEGVYIQTTGPQYETPAEIRAFGLLGADAVGMSTACEAIAAHHMGIRCCGISFISNLAAGISPNPLTHEEVKEAADKAGKDFMKLLYESIINIGKVL